MPSMAHEILVDFFKTRPSLAAEILIEVLGIALPAYTEARVVSIDLTEVQPAEYRADVVVVLYDGKVPVRVNIVEVQLGVDAGKRRSWPAYVCVAHATYGCLVDLLVVAPDPAIAAWCAEPIPLGPPGFVLTPPVLRGEAIPVVTDPAEAARRLELGMLSVMAHGDTAQAETIADALLPAIGRLDEERARFYLDILLNSVNEATRRALEAKMKGYEYQSDFAKKYVAQGRDEGEAKGEARALLAALRVRGIPVPDGARERILAALPPDAHERAVAEDVLVHLQRRLGTKPSRTPEEEEFVVSMQSTWEKARAEGEARGEARALLAALRARGFPVPDTTRERILAEKDPERLERWVERAVVAASIAEVLDGSS